MMDKSCGFENLVVWQKTHQFVLLTYNAIRSFPQEEFLGLTSQLRSAVVSIATNVAKGNEKLSNEDKLWFFTLADEAINETSYYLILSKDLGYINEETFSELITELNMVQKLLKSYTIAIRKKSHN